MASLFCSQHREQIIKRLESLTPESQRQWGEMNVNQMICHLQDVFYYTCGERKADFQSTAFSNFIGRFFVLYAPMAWPRGKIKGPKEAFTSKPDEFEKDREKLISYIYKFNASAVPENLKHPILGVLSTKQWGVFQYKHCDHHLKQFGV